MAQQTLQAVMTLKFVYDLGLPVWPMRQDKIYRGQRLLCENRRYLDLQYKSKSQKNYAEVL